MSAKYVIGIDLGTTNSALAYAALDVDKPQVQVLPIPQLVAAGTVEARTLLPSFLYIAQEHEVKARSFDLLKARGRDFVAGELARRQAAEMPDRTVGAAKSWLGHSKVDRHEPILPWNAPAEVPRISPVTASQRYLEHLAAAWHAAIPDAPIAEQHVVLTVPASFDASARELTREAALSAGWPQSLVLLEEPQAALYAWLADEGNRWRKQLKVGDTLLVCDIGGGTTDLTLIGVAEDAGELVLRRIAVGNHLLIGGDNMDLALAYRVSELFADKGTKLDPWQSISLWHSCRTAKETLLAADAPRKHSIAVLGRGSKLIGKTVSVEIDREFVTDLLVDGFFPKCDVSDRPVRRRMSGFQEIGLPFESDTAITRHIAEFLAQHGDPKTGPIQPTHLLFNGGVFKADSLRTRLVETLAGWSKKSPPRPLEGTTDLEHAVARGAAAYGWSKERGGVRIRGGTARSYYVGIETSGLAIPGAPRPLRALCVVPIGMEEGTAVDVPSQEIGLVVGEPAHFRFFSSSVRKQDKPGNLLSSWSEGDVAETDSLEATLPKEESLPDSYVPVHFQSKLTELGVFELWCVGPQKKQRWKLEFSVREDADAARES